MHLTPTFVRVAGSRCCHGIPRLLNGNSEWKLSEGVRGALSLVQGPRRHRQLRRGDHLPNLAPEWQPQLQQHAPTRKIMTAVLSREASTTHNESPDHSGPTSTSMASNQLPGPSGSGSIASPHFPRQAARLTDAAHAAWTQVVRPGDVVVDATCGRGTDTLTLAQMVGPDGRVFGFDIQEMAIQSTWKRCEEALEPAALDQVHLVHGCHSRMLSHVGRRTARVICFNLGYLPAGGDKSVVTSLTSTLAALEAALEAVCNGGLITVIAYTRHAGGQDEYRAVMQLLSKLPSLDWVVTETRMLNRNNAPTLFLVWRSEEGSSN